MATGDDRRGGLPYWVGFLFATALLAGTTIVLVLVVLPRRFVLQADLREAGISFPSQSPAFDVPEVEPLVEPAPLPGPVPVGSAEALWRDLRPLLDARMYGMALELMDDYLLEQPGDAGVRRERARALIALGNASAARTALAGLARDPGLAADQLTLARFLRDAGDMDSAARAYRALLGDRTNDVELRLELARAFLWAGAYEAAVDGLRRILLLDAANDGARVELARALWATGRPDDARAVLAPIDIRSPHLWEAVLLDLQISGSMAPYELPPHIDLSPTSRARRAVARDELEAADRWYRAALEADPTDRSLWKEWIDFRQYRREDLSGARDALERYGSLFELTLPERYRLAELHTWTGSNDRATDELDALLAAYPGQADAWALRGDLLRWTGDRVAAAQAYDRALRLDSQHPRARQGKDDLRADSERAVAAAEPLGIGPLFDAVGDSDDFFRLDADVDGAWTDGLYALRAAAGYRWVEGLALDGTETADGGPYAEAAVTRWWRQATVRTSLRGGLQHLDGFGTEVTLGADVEVPRAGAWALGASYYHGPAYQHTWTYESIEAGVRADALVLTAFRGFGDAWTFGTALDGALYNQPEADNARIGGHVSLGRRLSSMWRVELASSVLSFADAAPMATRRIYWDPELYWASTLTFGLDRSPPDAWGVGLLLTGGAALIDERDDTGDGWVPQFGIQASVVRPWAGGDLALSGFYRRGRERDYSSYGASLALRLRRAP